MNSYASLNENEYRDNELSTSLISRLLSSPLKVGLWNGGVLTWEYPSMGEDSNSVNHLLSVTSMNSTQHYEIIKVQLNNETNMSQHAKIVVQYHNKLDKSTTAFYSPNENAIVCFSEDNVTMLGGVLNGRGMNQYCIQENNYCSTAALLRCLDQGNLPLSWLAKGDICSTFTLETTISPGKIEEGLIWTFHSSSEELVRSLKNEMISKII